MVMFMNPFVYGKIVENRHFCPRDVLLSELCGCIESGQNSVVYGRRRVGKSSLVLNAGKRFPDRMLFLVDLFFTKDAGMFLEYCTNALLTFNHSRKGFLEKTMGALKRIRPNLKFDPDTGIPSFSLDVAQRDEGVLLNTIDDFFGFLGDEFAADQLVVCFDEFQSVLHYPGADSLLAKIRGKVQYHPFAYIFTGSDRSGLKKIFTQPQSPFYKSVRSIEVPVIPQEVFRPFLEEKFAGGERTVLDEVWNELFELDVPGDIQQLCAALWESSDQGDMIGVTTLREACERVFSQEIEGFRSLITDLTALQFRVLKVVASNGVVNLYSLDSQQAIGASSSSIRRSMTSLVRKWILVEDQGLVYFNNPFLKQFLTLHQI